MNITKGKVELKRAVLDGAVYLTVKAPGKVIFRTDFSTDYDGTEEEANAEFITEAFNIANQTGLSPKQLLEQRDELLKKLNEIVLIEGDYAEWNGINDTTLHEIKDLLKTIK